MIKKLLYRIFGSKAHTPTSIGYIWRRKYLVFHGELRAGDWISMDVQEYMKILAKRKKSKRAIFNADLR